MLTIWLDGAHGASENMRRDHVLLRRAEQGAAAVLRLYTFEPCGITLGYAQSPERELDLDACRRDGVEWAGRPTGGRALFHGREWTYCLASAATDPVWGGGPHETYARARAPVLAALRRLGVPAEAVRGERAAEDASPAEAGAPARPCFATTTRHEIVTGGRKLVGSAQRRTARGAIQQGCILTGRDHLRIVDYLRLDPERRARWREQLRARSASSDAWLARHTLADFADALRAVSGASAWIEGGEGLNLLTVAENAPYTPPTGEPQSRLDRIERSAVS